MHCKKWILVDYGDKSGSFHWYYRGEDLKDLDSFYKKKVNRFTFCGV